MKVIQFPEQEFIFTHLNNEMSNLSSSMEQILKDGLFLVQEELATTAEHFMDQGLYTFKSRYTMWWYLGRIPPNVLV